MLEYGKLFEDGDTIGPELRERVLKQTPNMGPLGPRIVILEITVEEFKYLFTGDIASTLGRFYEPVQSVEEVKIGNLGMLLAMVLTLKKSDNYESDLACCVKIFESAGK